MYKLIFFTLFLFLSSPLFAQKNKLKAYLDLKEFYNIIYQYENDCLVASLEYNKDYYTDRDLKADESIYLNLTIIPFGQTKSPNLKK